MRAIEWRIADRYLDRFIGAAFFIVKRNSEFRGLEAEEREQSLDYTAHC